MANEDQVLLEQHTDKPMSDEEFLKAAEGAPTVELPSIDVVDTQPTQEDPEYWFYQDPRKMPAKQYGTMDTIGDTGRGVVAGVRDAGQEFLNTSAAIMDKVGTVVDYQDNPDFWKQMAHDNELPDLADPQTGIGKFVKGTSQFLTGFIPAFRGARMIQGAAGVGKLGTIANTTLGGTAAGVTADFIVMDPYEEKLSNFAKDSGIPGLDNAITQYLATDETDGELEARYKMALEGAFTGKALEYAFDISKGIISAVKEVKARKRNAQGISETDANLNTVDENGNLTGTKDNGVNIDPYKPISQIDETQAQSLTEAFLKGDFEGAGKNLSEHINLDYLDTPEDVNDFIQGLFDHSKETIQKTVKGWDQTKAQAAGLGDNALEEAAARFEGADGFALRTRIAQVAVAQKVVALGRAVSAATTPQDKAIAVGELVRNMGKAHAVMQIASNVRSSAGRILNTYKIRLDGEEYLNQINDLVRLHGGYAEVGRLAEMISQLPDSAGVVNAIKDFNKPTWGDAVREMFVNGLFTPITLTTNFASNIVTAMTAPVERLSGAIYSQSKGSGEVGYGEALAQLTGYLTAIPEGLSILGKSYYRDTPMFSGVDAFDASIKPRHAIEAETFGLGGYSSFKDKPLLYTMGKGIDLFGTLVRAPGTRALMATDEAFKSINYRAELKAQAYRTARKEGMEAGSPEFKDRMNEIIAGAYQAKPDSPYYGIHLNSKTASERLTFTEDLGEMGNHLTKGIRSNPNTVLLMPFIKTPTNLVKYFVRRSPGFASFSEQIAKDLEAGGARADLATSQVSLGSALLVSSMAMAAGGYITGDGSRNPDVKKLMMDSNWRPNSIRFDDGSSVSYQRFDPSSSFLTLGANIHEAVQAYIRNNQDKDDTELEDGVMEIMGVGIASMTRLVSNRSWLSQTSQWVDALMNPGNEKDQTANIRKVLTKTAASAATPFSNQMKWANQQFSDNDVILREADGFLDEIKKKIPGLSDELPPVPTTWGDATSLDQAAGAGLVPALRNKNAPDEVDKEMQRLQSSQVGAIIGKPSYDIDHIKLDPTERWNYHQFYAKYMDSQDGKTLWASVKEMMQDPDYQRATDTVKADMINKIVNTRRAHADELFLQDAALNGGSTEVRKVGNMVLYPLKRDIVRKVAASKASQAIKKDPTLNKQEIKNDFIKSIQEQ